MIAAPCFTVPDYRLKSPNPRKGIETDYCLEQDGIRTEGLKSPNPRKGIETKQPRVAVLNGGINQSEKP